MKPSSKQIAEARARLGGPDGVVRFNETVTIGVSDIDAIKALLAATEPSKKRTKETFPDDLELDDKARVFAEKKGFRGSQIDEMWERFDAYHRSGGTESADWSASWRTWVLNQIRFGERPQAQVAPPRSFQPSLADMTERTDLAPAPRRGARF